MQKSIEQIKKGSSYTEEFSYSQDAVNKFAEISGDKNPLHLDEKFAAKSIFKRRIIHGYLGTSIFSKVFAMNFPGEGTIYLKQELKFLEPMFATEKYTAKFKVEDHILDKHRALVKTEIYNSNLEIIVTGQALIQNNKLL